MARAIRGDGASNEVVPSYPLSRQALLVTNNTREFAVVPGLRLDNWVIAA